MNTPRIALYQAVNTEEDFLAFLVQEVHSESYRQRTHRIEQGPHPTKELLHAYVWDALDKERRKIIRKHVTFCPGCMRQLGRLARIRDDSEARFFSWADKAEIGIDPPGHALETTPRALLDNLASELWEPEGAGESLVAASSAVTQEHEFHTEAGTVKVLCAWGPASGGEPAFIWLSWKAELQDDTSFLIRFIDPECQHTRYEIDPQMIRHGNQTFTQDVLGFDPVGQKWAVSVVFSENEG